MVTVKYIITNDKVYIAHNPDNSIYTTKNLDEAAKWEDHIKCQNALNVLPKSYKNLKFKIKDIDVEELHIETIIEPITNINTKVDIAISIIEENFKLLNEYNRSLNNEMSNIDKEICDISHAAEFFNLNAAEGFKLYKMLQRARKERRRIKDDTEKLKIVNSSNLESWMNGNVSKIINSKLDNRGYTPRVLVELFDR